MILPRRLGDRNEDAVSDQLVKIIGYCLDVLLQICPL